jgi:hypothetical protein
VLVSSVVDDEPMIYYTLRQTHLTITPPMNP